ncbi:hypothetical protein LY78DRAFT_490128 [Colletotrichum sublineola]|nr:hypothetical protein LY78DRAFT_490128 [Colletotrichum sublineola]
MPAGRICQHIAPSLLFASSRRRASLVRFVLDDGSRILSSWPGSAEPLPCQGRADKVPGRDRRSPPRLMLRFPLLTTSQTWTNAPTPHCARPFPLVCLQLQDVFPDPAVATVGYILRLPPCRWLALGTCRPVSLYFKPLKGTHDTPVQRERRTRFLLLSYRRMHLSSCPIR